VLGGCLIEPKLTARRHKLQIRFLLSLQKKMAGTGGRNWRARKVVEVVVANIELLMPERVLMNHVMTPPDNMPVTIKR